MIDTPECWKLRTFICTDSGSWLSKTWRIRKKDKFINYKLGLEIWVGRTVRDHETRLSANAISSDPQKNISNSPALDFSTFCYLAQGIVRGINVGAEIFTDNWKIKFPIMWRWWGSARWLLVMELGQCLFGEFSLSLAVTLWFLVFSLSYPQDKLAQSMALWKGTGMGCWGENELLGRRGDSLWQYFIIFA